MDTEKLEAIQVSATNTALSDFALRHSVGLGLYSRGDYPHSASGTLLKIDSHYFIATAAHCIRGVDLADIRVAYREKNYSAQFRLIGKGTLGGARGDPFDVGYLEVDKSVAEHTPAEFLTLNHVAIEYDPAESLAFLFGFPTELIPKGEARKRRFRLKSLGLLTLLATDESIPDFVDPDIDVVLIYPEQGVLGEQRQLHSLPHPEGISGGSMWIYDPNVANPLIGVHNAHFIGIQKSWFAPQRVAIGNKVINLLRLVAADYLDLRDILNHKLGTL